MSGYRPRPRSFGTKQPTKIEQVAAVRSLICGCRDLDALDIGQLAYRCGRDRREVECWIGAERGRRAGV